MVKVQRKGLGSLWLGEPDAARGHINFAHIAQECGDVTLLAKHVANRRRDQGSRQASRGDLIQQGLKKMMIAAIDQRDAHGLGTKCLRRF